MEYDPFSQKFQADPFPVYKWMRDEAPVFYSETWNWWALSRFEDVRAAATDPQTFLSYEGIDIDDTAKDQSGPGFLPVPAVIRWNSPGRSTSPWPRLSLCSSAPSRT